MGTTWKQPHRQIHTLGKDVLATPRRISKEYDSRGMVSTLTSWDSATAGSGTILNQVQNVYNEFGQQSGHQALLAGVQALACCDSARDLPRGCNFGSQLTFVNSHVSLEMQAKACTPTKTLNGTQTAITSGAFEQQWGLDAGWSFLNVASPTAARKILADQGRVSTGMNPGLNSDKNVQATTNKANEITGITNSVGAAWATPTYDPAGNMARMV